MNPVLEIFKLGRWGGVQGAVSPIWDIDSAGKLAGTSTTGCTYKGTFKILSGIALLNTAKTGLSVA